VAYLLEENVEVNVRYLPQCLVSDQHRKTAYGFKQLPYDLHENDYASWSWTDLPAQRTAGMELTPPFPLGKRLELGAMRNPLRSLDRRFPKLGKQLHQVKQGLERQWASKTTARADSDKLEALYQADGVMRAKEYTGYHHVEACQDCSLKGICDGVYGDYAELFGVEGLRPVSLDQDVIDPQHYTRQQHKVIHPLDRGWLENGDEPIDPSVMACLARSA
jgi:hypothetical protein